MIQHTRLWFELKHLYLCLVSLTLLVEDRPVIQPPDSMGCFVQELQSDPSTASVPQLLHVLNRLEISQNHQPCENLKIQ